MTDYVPIVDAIRQALPDVKPAKGMRVGLKFTSPTQTTHNGFVWPDPGKWTPTVSDDEWNPTTCAPGGYHAALTIAAAQSGGHRYTHAMLVGWNPRDGEYQDAEGKVKCRRIKTLRRIDLAHLIREGHLYGADLYGADLVGADLSRANLSRADLSRANLSRADLTRAYLVGADLSRANLYGANLYGADLSRAYLVGADLSGAYLVGANLSRANLVGAYLVGADLSGAYLSRADLSRANLVGANLSRADLTYVKGYKP